MKIKLSSAALKLLKRRSLPVKLTATVKDPAGTSRQVASTVTLAKLKVRKKRR